MELINPTMLQLSLGLELAQQFSNGKIPFVDTVAIMLMSDEELLASRTKPDIMNKKMLEASKMDMKEVVESAIFFMKHLTKFSETLEEEMTKSQTIKKPKKV